MTERDEMLALADELNQYIAKYRHDWSSATLCMTWSQAEMVEAALRTAAPAPAREALDQTVKFDECESPEPTLRQIIRQYYIQGLQPDANLAIKLSERYIAALSAAPAERGREPEVVAAVQQAIMRHPYFDGGPATAFGFANTAIEAYRTALSPLPAGNMDKPTPPLPLSSEQRLSTEAVAWQARDERYPYINGIVTDRKETVEAWRESGIKHCGLYALPPAGDRDAVRADCELTVDDVHWIVNDNGELGVRIGEQCFFLYKGTSLIYEDAKHDDGSQMYYRPVWKREFGECCHPINRSDPRLIGTVSLDDDDAWKPLPAAIRNRGGDETPAPVFQDGGCPND